MFVTPEETWEEAYALYITLKLLGHNVAPPPDGIIERASLISAEYCHSEFFKEMWLRFSCEQGLERLTWTLFCKVSLGDKTHPMFVLFKKFEQISLFNHEI